MAEVLLGGRRLNELKVTELKAELDKRGLPKKGVKSVLVQRLKNAILKEALTQPEVVDVGDDEEGDESLLNNSRDESTTVVQEDQDQKTSVSATKAAPIPDKVEPAEAKREEGASTADNEADKLEEVPETVASDTATTAVKDVPVELQATSAVLEEPATSAATDQESPEIDIEGPVDGADPLDNDIPMDLTTPLSSGSELNLSFDSELVEEKEHQDKITASSEVATIKKDEDETMDVDVVGEGATTSSTTPRTERVDSVQIDPSFQPESEELLYEGDVENDGDENKAAAAVQDGQASAATTTTAASTAHEEGFVLAVDDTFAADLEVTPSGGKSSPKKQEKKQESSSSKPKSESKSSSKAQSSSSSQSTKSKSESSGSSSTANASSSSSSSSKHQVKESGKSSSSGSSEATSSSSSAQCNLWVSGLATSVRALDLQTLFSRYGQVLSAKIVAKSRARPQNRFGYVSMAASDQADRCIKELNGTELKGRKITVEVAKSQKSNEMSLSESPSAPPAKDTSSSSTSTPAKSPRVSNSKSDQPPSKSEKTSKTPSEKSGGEEKPRDLRRSLDGSTSSSKGAKIQITRKRSPSPPVHRRVSSRRSRTPPPARRRSPVAGRRVRSRSRSPPRYGRVGSATQSRDAREIIRREMEKRGGHSDPFMRERERQAELRLQERRLAHERQQEMVIRRQLEMEHSRREQELARRMQEATTRETRERELRERQLAERDRQFRERERELREKEFRERQRREALEQELRQREAREKEFRDRERKLKEQHERELREREIKIQREKEIRDREARANLDRERELREREARLKQEQEKLEREHRLYQEEQHKLREQAERERQAALAAKEEAERARINYEREERERRIREKEEHKHQEEERRSKREREQRERDQREKRERDEIEKRSQHSSGWLGKRPHQESGSSGSGYSSVKRPSLHGSSDSYGGTVFSRLDPQTQQKKIESNIQPLMSTHVDSFRRPSDHRSGHSSGNVYAKAMSGSLAQTVRSTPGTTDLSPELLNAATQALENLRKSVHGVGSIGSQLSLPKPMAHLNVMSAHAQLQQLAASNASAALSAASGASRIPVSSMLPGMSSRSSLDVHQQAGSMLRPPVIGSQGSGSGGMGVAAFSSLHGKSSGHYGGASAGGVTKLPPEDERYNRRFGGRSSHHQSGGRPGYKGRI